jgi:hypothetical protein
VDSPFSEPVDDEVGDELAHGRTSSVKSGV